MTAPASLPPRPSIRTGGRTLTPSARDVQSAIDGARPGDRVVLPAETLTDGYRVHDTSDVTIEVPSGCIVKGDGAKFYGDAISVYHADRIRVTGAGLLSAVSCGVGIYSGVGHVVDGLRIAKCGGQGVLVNHTDGDRSEMFAWVEGLDVSACGDAGHSPDPAQPDYWQFGDHCIYFGGGRTGTIAGAVVGCHVHDQPNGYGIQVGGQARSVVVAANLIERISGASAGGVVSDRNARGIQFFGSYEMTRDCLAVSNVIRDCPGAWVGAGPNGNIIMADVRDNVFWNCGPLDLAWGAEVGLRDAGRNVERNVATVAEALAAGLLDRAFVLNASPPPPSPPTVDDLIDQATDALAKTTVSGVQYAKNLAAGKYPDPLKTYWGKALSLLDAAKRA